MNDKLVEMFDARLFHQSIVEVSRNLFVDSYFPQAIFEATKCVEKEVRTISGLTHLHGTKLMSEAFKHSSPKVNLSYDSNEQKGFQKIFIGVMQGIRNEKAHDIVMQNDIGKTLDYLGLMSLLLRRLDERVSPHSTRSDKTQG